MSRELLLAHGLWVPRAAMGLLASRLRASGYNVHLFAYRGRDAYEANLDALARFAQGKTFFVGHSLGGVMIFDLLTRQPRLPADAAVLLGAPVRGSFAGRRFGRSGLGRWMMGESRACWEQREARWSRSTPLGVLAGTVPLGLGRLFGSLPGTNDGVVCVDETTIEGMSARALVPQGHSMLVVSGQVADMVSRFLARGAFA